MPEEAGNCGQEGREGGRQGGKKEENEGGSAGREGRRVGNKASVFIPSPPTRE